MEVKPQGTKVLVDPVLGDNGTLYRTCTQELCEEMRELIQYADVITPNLTEACLLTETPWSETGWSKNRLADLAYKLLFMGPGAVVLTGAAKSHSIINVVLERGKEPVFFTGKRVETSRHGTGDVFSAVLAGEMVHSVPLEEAVRRAATLRESAWRGRKNFRFRKKRGSVSRNACLICSG